MQITTILNRVQKFKSFVYGSARFVETDSGPEIEIDIRPRSNSRPICSCCGQPAARNGHQSNDPRRFRFVPFWAMKVFFVYRMRRVMCRQCGVKTEQVPWAEGKSPRTTTWQSFLANWSKSLAWKEVAQRFRTSWNSVFRSVKTAVAWGLEHRDLSGVESIGVDEIQWKKGHKYQTLVYQIDKEQKRLLWMGPERKAKTLLRFFRMLGRKRTANLKFVCSDMWPAYLKVITKKAGAAVHVLDRFHVMKLFGEAIDTVRREEVKRLEQDGYEAVLKNSRWCLLKRPENLTNKQTVKISEILKYNLKTVRSYLFREEFQRFWKYKSVYWAERFFNEWSTRVMRSRIEPMKKVVRTLRKHKELLLNWFRAKGAISAGIVEGMNNNVKLTMRKAYGFRMQNAIETALYHGLGKLPEPKFVHKFW